MNAKNNLIDSICNNNKLTNYMLFPHSLHPPVPPSVLTYTGATKLLAQMSLSPMQTYIAPSALLASFVPPPVLTDTGASRATAFLALFVPQSVLADTASSALLALTTPPAVLADAASSALLASTAAPSVLTDTASSALLALTAEPPVLTVATPSGYPVQSTETIIGDLSWPVTRFAFCIHGDILCCFLLDSGLRCGAILCCFLLLGSGLPGGVLSLTAPRPRV